MYRLRYFLYKIKKKYILYKLRRGWLKVLKKSLKNYDIFQKPLKSQNNYTKSFSLLCFDSIVSDNECQQNQQLWPFLLSDILNIKTFNSFDQQTCNVKLASNIIKYCNEYNPKAIFVVFASLSNIPEYTTMGLSTINYNQVLEYYNSDLNPLTIAGNHYVNEYGDINGFLRFVQIFKYIQAYCVFKKIDFFWYSFTPVFKALTKDNLLRYFNTNTFINIDGSIINLQKKSPTIHYDLANHFANLYNESAC